MKLPAKFFGVGAALAVAVLTALPASAMPAAAPAALAGTPQTAVSDVAWRPRAGNGLGGGAHNWRGGQGPAWRNGAWRGGPWRPGFRPGYRWAFRPGYGWGWWAPAMIGAGIVAGAAVAAPYYYGPGSYTYAPGPGYCRVLRDPYGPYPARWVYVPCGSIEQP